jgi:hypothetical protein
MSGMSDADVLLARLAARRGSIILTAEAHAEGVSDTELWRRRRSGLLVAERRGVMRHAAVPYDRDVRWRAAVAACGADAYLSHRAAGAFHAMRGIRRVRPEVTSPHTDLPRNVDGTVHRTKRYDEQDVVTVGGLRVSTVARTALDLCAVLPLSLTSSAIEHAVISKRVTLGQLLSLLERVGRRGVRGTADLRHIVRSGRSDALLQSMLEKVVANALRPLLLPAAVRQHPLTCVDGRRVVLDFAWPDVGLAVEADGMRWHASRREWEATQARSRSIQRSGWLHLTYGWEGAPSLGPEVVDAYRARSYRVA